MPPKGFKHSEETKEKIRQKLKGKKMSEETKNKMSISRIGHPFWGKKDYIMSDKAKENIRQGINEKRYTEEYAQKLSDTKKGTKNHQSKLTEKQVIEIRNLHKTGQWSHQAIADRYNVKRPTISDIINKRTWKHI